jgi:hypothetical protein
MPKPTMVLFGDACDPSALETVDGMAHQLDDPDQEGWLRYQLKPHRVEIDPVAPQDKPRFFINYRSDNGGLAAELFDRELTRRLGNAAVFRDRRSIRPAADFPPEILDKVRGCEQLLVVVCPGWENTRLADGRRRLDDADDWVRKEIREARTNEVKVVPVIVGARPKLAEADLPEDIRFLVNRQFVHLPEGFGERDVEIAVDRLLA